VHICPYSSETITACSHYHPNSAHGDYPEAAHCCYAVATRLGSFTRQMRCHRVRDARRPLRAVSGPVPGSKRDQWA
jgi:hypothetical protein